MYSINFNQIICTNVSESGTTIDGIFDTLLCDPNNIHFYIYIFYSQYLSQNQSLKQFYYRIVLRHLSDNASEKRNYRVDSGVFWGDNENSNIDDTQPSEVYHRSSKRGISGRLAINYYIDLDFEGNYEVDLYVKELDGSYDIEKLNTLSVKELSFVTLSPFKVFFKAKNN